MATEIENCLAIITQVPYICIFKKQVSKKMELKHEILFPNPDAYHELDVKYLASMQRKGLTKAYAKGLEKIGFEKKD
jgi:hypothetical protein